MEQIVNFVEAMFRPLPKTEHVLEIKQDILENLQEKYHDLVEEGKNENEALGIVISQFGSMDELCRSLGLEPEEPQAPQEQQERDNAEHERLLREYQSFLPRQRLAIAAAVFLFILSPIAGGELNSPLLFFALIAAGVGLLIYFCGRASDYRALLGMENLEPPRQRGTSARRGRLAGIVMLAVTIVYLILGFTMGLWHPGWIVFLLGPLVITVVDYFEAVERDEEEKK